LCNELTYALLALNEFKGIGSKTIIDIFMEFKYIYGVEFKHNQFISYLSKKINFNEDLIEEFENKINFIKYELSKDDCKDIKVVNYFDLMYPFQLKLLKNPPLFLFCKGNIELLTNKYNIAVVGTRENSNIGEKVAIKTAEFFASKKYTIVSGLAKGIDTAGHIGALNENGHTIAILTDLIKIYPAENRELAENILKQNGLLFSEIAPWKNVFRSAFVDRDRLQSGMSLGTFVIETDIKGGTMHTVKFTLEQNRHLFVPDFQILNYEEDFSKINGTKYLFNKGKALLYSKMNYDEVLKLLEQKEKELSKEYELELINKRNLWE